MNNLESIVPPLELCKKIPAGKFADSALIRYYGLLGCGIAIRQDFVEAFPDYKEAGNVSVYPAPTLAEILGAFEDKHFCTFSATPGRWVVVHGGGDSDVDENASAAALRLWLEVEGMK